MMLVRRTERIKVKHSFTLMQLARQSKNVYNYGNYVIKRQLKNSKYMTSEYELVDMIRYHPCYTDFIPHSAQQTIKFLVKNWKAYFVTIPFLTLVRKLQYKAEEAGIKVILTEEDYTSKCSVLDNEVIKKHPNYLGRRLKRGLFRSKTGILLNADCNSAGNIGRKVFPLVFTSGTVDAVSHPHC